VAYTLAAGRKAFRHRRAVVARCGKDAAAALAGTSNASLVVDGVAGQPSIVWAFAGGDVYSGLGAGLYAGEPLYREAFDEAVSRLDADVAGAVCCISRLSARGDQQIEASSGPSRTFPALVAVQYAVGRVLEDWGLAPSAIIADGAGTYAAACCAGVLDIHQAIELAAFEGQLLEKVEIASHTASGKRQAALDDAREQFVRRCGDMSLSAPTGRLISNATGHFLTAEEATDPNYWGERLGRIGEARIGLGWLREQSAVALVAIGSGHSLTNLLERQPVAPAVAAATLRDRDSADSDLAVLLGAAGRLWAAGAPLQPLKLFSGERRRRVGLPTYPFERQRCVTESEAAASRPNPALLSATPLEDVESDLTRMWRDVLDVEDVHLDQVFFDLGGHSLSAVRLFDRIRNRFGVELPLATLFETRTIASLSRLIRDRLAGLQALEWSSQAGERNTSAAFTARSMVAVQPGTGGPPLFVVHGAAGNVLNVRDLARAMSPAQPVYGLQAVGIDGISPPRATIEEMAASYLDEVRVVQPRGPFFLAGYSGGGVVAFEMARRLDAAGDPVGLLALIDTFHPQMPPPRISARSRLERLGQERLSYVRDSLKRVVISFREARAERLIGQHLAADRPVPLSLREQHLIKRFDAAARQYVPAPWPGRALLFKAEQVDYYHRAGGPTYGWDTTITGGVEIVAIPGDHHSIMIGANASRIAQRIGEAIAQVTGAAITDADR
jgi:thioesterase domain-containing protein/acyl carrier protein